VDQSLGCLPATKKEKRKHLLLYDKGPVDRFEMMPAADFMDCSADEFLCQVLRGEKPYWPENGGANFASSFLRRSKHHGVQPLIFDLAYRASLWANWPPAVRTQLADAVRGNVALNLLRAHRVKEFLEELSRRGIVFLLTKGEALARTHYASPDLRPRSDTDLFIAARDIQPVHRALLESGHQVLPPLYKSHQFTGIWNPQGEAVIRFDIHWRILNDPRFARLIGFNEAQTQAVALPGMGNCRTLDSVDTLLLACMHRKGNVHHDEDRLIWLYDIHLLVSAMSDRQLHQFTHKAVEKRLQVVCLEALYSARSRFHTEVPTEVEKALQTARLTETPSRRFMSCYLSLLVDDFRCLPDLRSKLCLLQELFFLSPESLLRRYNKESRFWLPYLYLERLLGSIMKWLSSR